VSECKISGKLGKKKKKKGYTMESFLNHLYSLYNWWHSELDIEPHGNIQQNDMGACSKSYIRKINLAAMLKVDYKWQSEE
jgi:hypothetical protein